MWTCVRAHVRISGKLKESNCVQQHRSYLSNNLPERAPTLTRAWFRTRLAFACRQHTLRRHAGAQAPVNVGSVPVGRLESTREHQHGPSCWVAARRQACSQPGRQEGRQAGREAGRRKAGRQAGGQEGTQAGRQAREAGSQAARRAGRNTRRRAGRRQARKQAGGLVGKQAGRQPGRQKQAGRQAGRKARTLAGRARGGGVDDVDAVGEV